MKPVQDWMNDLRLRVSYGVNGTLPSSYYGYLGLSSLTSNYNNNPGISQSQLENKELTWETNYNFNSGIDLGFFDSRLRVTFEYYVRTTKDLLYSRPLSLATGFSSYLQNIGKLRNKGYELELRSTNIETKDFHWSSSLNFGHNANKILKLDGNLKQVTSGVNIHKVGLPYSTYYMIEFAGIDPEDGEPMFYKNSMDENGELNRDKTKDPRAAEKVILQCADPTITGGFGNSLSYNGSTSTSSELLIRCLEVQRYGRQTRARRQRYFEHPDLLQEALAERGRQDRHRTLHDRTLGLHVRLRHDKTLVQRRLRSLEEPDLRSQTAEGMDTENRH